MIDQERPCWIDEVGDRLEAAGVDPGRIWEISFQLTEDLISGAVIETTGTPGVKPKSPAEIKRVIVRKLDGEEIEMPGLRPLVVTRFIRILEDMC